MTAPKPDDGLAGDDKQQGDLTDKRQGAYDQIRKPIPGKPLEQHPTAHEAAQGGADVRSPTTPPDTTLPEGLRRPRKGPLSPTRGRKGEPD